MAKKGRMMETIFYFMWIDTKPLKEDL